MSVVLAALTLGSPTIAQVQHDPVVLVHYMPWYQAKPHSGYWGYHWTLNSSNPDIVNEDGLRSVASHYYPSIGPYDSSDPDLLEYHTLLMKVAGIDGVIVDWYGTSDLYDYPLIDAATNKLFDAIGSAGLRFSICYEDYTLTALIDNGKIESADAVAQAQADMISVRDRWAAGSQYMRWKGQAVVFNFGPQHLQSSAEWQDVFNVFPTAPAFVTEDRFISGVGSGAFPWPPMWASANGVLTPTRLGQYLNSFYASSGSWPLVVGSAFPGFHDYYEQAGVGNSYGYLDSRDGATFSETLDHTMTAAVDMIQIVTWNDFGEGTVVEPTLENGYEYLLQIQSAVSGWKNLPFGPEDLELPLRLFELRKSSGGNPESGIRLDSIAASLVADDPATAWSILNNFVGVAAGPEPSQSMQIAPNPSDGRLTIGVQTATGGTLQVEAYDLLGRRVAALPPHFVTAGSQRLDLDLGGVPSGTYLIRLLSGREGSLRWSWCASLDRAVTHPGDPQTETGFS